MFRDLMDDNVKLVKQNGQVIENIIANVQPKLIFIDDVKIPIEEGDHIIRKLPNGLEEIYKILDRGFYNNSGGIPAHYQIKVQKILKIIEDENKDSINLIENEIGKVFIVHGHNEERKETVAQLLRSLGLEVIILHEQPNLGRTIIEKLIHHSNVNYAVILLTSDDVGRSNNETELKKRSRQNVILELGYFIGKLGRSKVCTLYEEGIELPSDYLGVLYIPFGNSDNWKDELLRELKAIGFKIII